MKNEIEILLIEDNPNDAELAIRALKKCNITNKIVRVCDGEEALNYIFADGDSKYQTPAIIPRLILLDLKLPKINGFEVLKKLKSNPITMLIPVVILTSSQEESDMIQSYKLGVNSFIVKPVDFDKFIDAVRNIGYYWLLLNQQPDIKKLL